MKATSFCFLIWYWIWYSETITGFYLWLCRENFILLFGGNLSKHSRWPGARLSVVIPGFIPRCVAPIDLLVDHKIPKPWGFKDCLSSSPGRMQCWRCSFNVEPENTPHSGQGYPVYFWEPHWKSMRLPEISTDPGQSWKVWHPPQATFSAFSPEASRINITWKRTSVVEF